MKDLKTLGDTDVSFSAINRPRQLPGEIARDIEMRIRSGDLKPGGRLPTEAVMSQEFGVGRSAIREAIARLREGGLVETRQGVGAFVSKYPGANSFRIDTDTMRTSAEVREIFEMRLDMEVGIAAMAARRRSKEQLDRIEAALKIIWQTVDQDDEDIDCDIAFYQSVSEAAGNSLFSDFMNFFTSKLRLVIAMQHRDVSSTSSHKRRVYREYAKIFEAIRISDPDMARRAAWNHVLRSADRFGLRGLQGWEETRMTMISGNYYPDCQAPDPAPRVPSFEVPPLACDCHAHIFGPEALFPFTDYRSYTPNDATLDQYQRVLAALGIERGVIVQPSVYGDDNRATLHALQQGGKRFRGVVVVGENIDDRELERMHELGVRGVRINLLYKSGTEVSDIRRMADRVKAFRWHLQFLVDVSEFADLYQQIKQLPVDAVFDHMGHVPTSMGVENGGFQEMLALLKDGKGWAKLSGAYRLTTRQELPYDDISPYARAVIEANPDRVVWATDWPHPAVTTRMPNVGDLLDMLQDWAPLEEIQKKILVDNPAKLYGFGKEDAST